MWYTNTVYIMPGKAFIKGAPQTAVKSRIRRVHLRQLRKIYFKGEDI